jgi:L-serine dehydratase
VKTRFHTVQDLASVLESENLPLGGYLVAREAFIQGKTVDEVNAELDRRIQITRAALDRGLSAPQLSFSGLTRGNAVRLAAPEKAIVTDPFYTRAIAYALAVAEVNACGGRVISFPTAGSCGIVPGTLWAFRDTRPSGEEIDDARFREAFLVASCVGILIAERATLAGAEGGCQAECGAAGAMAAAGLASLCGCAFQAIFDAAALSLKNSLGLACDPVAGLVEVPCVKRNAFLAANALTAVSLELAGVTSVIPFDEVVTALKAIGDSLPANLRENAQGGLAVTPTGLSYREKIRDPRPPAGV